jgi:hypothetical protein
MAIILAPLQGAEIFSNVIQGRRFACLWLLSSALSGHKAREGSE